MRSFSAASCTFASIARARAISGTSGTVDRASDDLQLERLREACGGGGIGGADAQRCVAEQQLAPGQQLRSELRDGRQCGDERYRLVGIDHIGVQRVGEAGLRVAAIGLLDRRAQGTALRGRRQHRVADAHAKADRLGGRGLAYREAAHQQQA